MILWVGSFLTLGVLPAKAGEPDFEPGIGPRSGFTSNPYHAAEQRGDRFDGTNNPGECFHGTEGAGGFAVHPGLDLTWQWDLDERRGLAISFGARHDLHTRNSIADYLEPDGGASHDLTRRDTLGPAAGFLPDRFRRRLSLEDPDTGEEFSDYAGYRQFRVAPRLIHRWTQDWAGGVEYEFSQRDHDEPFGNCDRDRHTVTAMVTYDGFKGPDITLGVGLGTTGTPLDTEFGVKVDRSYNDLFVKLGVTFDLCQRWRAKLGTRYRVREYTTKERADTARYGRTDDFWAVEAEVGKWFRRDLYVGVLAGWARNDSHHEDDTLASDEDGYEEFLVGVVTQWRF